MSKNPNFEKYEHETREYYDANRNPLRFPPVVKDQALAEEIAHEVNTRLSTEEELSSRAMRYVLTTHETTYEP